MRRRAWALSVALLGLASAARATATNDFFLRDLASEFAGYDVIRATENAAGAQRQRGIVVTGTPADDLIYSFVGPAISTTTLAAGTWTFNIWAGADPGNGADITLKAYVFARDLNGVENLLFTSSYNTAIGLILPSFELETWTFATASPRTVNATDRLVVKVYAADCSANGVCAAKSAGDMVTISYNANPTVSLVTTPFDVTGPGQVSPLGAVTGGVGQVNLTWSSPGNDGALNPLLAGGKYAVQYSTYVAPWDPTQAQLAFPINATIAPNTAQAQTATGLVGGTSYYFALWTQDEIGNLSPVSSTASAAAGRPAVPGALAPALTGSSVTFASAQWTSGGNPAGTYYNLRASTAADFSGTVLTSTTYNASGSVFGLLPGTSYALQVDAVIGVSSSVYRALGSTVTVPATPTAPGFANVYVTSAACQWADALNPPFTQYTLRASTAANLTGTLYALSTLNTFATLTGLSGRTTYYFQVNASTNGRSGAYVSFGATTTLVAPPATLATTFTSVFVTSAAAQWGAGGNPGGSLYNLQASTAPDFSGTVLTSGTFNTSAVAPGLSSSTFYYFQVDAVITGSSSVFTSLGSTVTQPSPPLSAASTYTAVNVNDASAQWNPNGNGPAAVFDLQASTAANFTGTIFSSSTANAFGQVVGLSGQTLYFFQVRARTASGATAYTTLGSTTTQNNPAVPPGTVAPAFTQVTASSVTAQWSAGGNPGNATYTLQASTAPNFSGVLFSSATPGFNAMVGGLSGDTTYYFQVVATVGAGNAYTALGSTITLPNVPGTSAPNVATIGVTSATVEWANGSDSTATIYDAYASTAADFSGALVSSSTFNLSATLSPLTLDTTYYLEVRARGNGQASAFLNLGSAITFPSAPGASAPTYTAVSSAGVTAQWTANGNGGGVTYALQASTAADFSGTLFSSQTFNLSAAVAGLSGMTTYFFEVDASTNGNTGAFAALGSTLTLPAPPGTTAPAFTAVWVTSASVQWLSGGNGSGARYALQASTAADFSGTLVSSTTANAFATLTALSADTVYYFRVAAQGGGFSSAFVALGSTQTFPSPPGAIVPFYTMVGISSVTARWTSGGNPAGAVYTLAASTAPNMSGTVVSSATAGLSATVVSLAGATTYYFFVKATAGGLDSAYAVLGGTKTQPPAATAGNTFYFRQVLADQVSGFDTLRATEPLSNAVDAVRFINCSLGTDDLIYTYMSPPVGVTTLPGGLWSFRMWGIDLLDGPNGLCNGSFKAIVYIRSGLSQSQYFSSSAGAAIGGTLTRFNWLSAAIPARAVNPTDRIVVEVYVTDAGGGKVNGDTMEFHHDSTASDSFVGPPFDVTPPGAALNLAAATGAGQGSVYLTWTSTGNDGTYKNLLLGSQYMIQYATFSAAAWSSASAQVTLSTGNVSAGTAQSYTLGGLTGGSTYFFQLWTLDESNNASALSNQPSAMAQIPPAPGVVAPAFLMVGVSSATAQWTANGNGAGTTYTLYTTTAANFSGTQISSATPGLSATVAGLSANTTYYFWAKATVNGGDSAYQNLGSTITLPAPPVAGAPAFSMVALTSVTAQWTTANPAGTLYTLQLSTAPDFSGALASSATYNAAATATALSSATLYYARVNASGNGKASAFVSLGSTLTLTAPPVAASPAIASVFNSSVTAQWVSGGDPAGTLYNLQASTASDYSGTILSSQTLGVQASVQGLTGSSSYYLRVDAVVGLSSSAFVALGSTVTLPDVPQAAATAFSAVYASSAAAQWLAGNNGPLALFTLQASTASNFSGTIASTTTPSLSVVEPGLAGAATYYFRVNAAISSQASGWLSLGSTVTASAVPTAAAAPFASVFFTSATAQWASADAAGALYTLQFSTAPDFSGTVFSSATYNLSAQIAGLTAATAYSARVNAAGRTVSDYLAIGSTVTQAAAPLSIASTFTMVGISSITAQWGSGGDGSAALYTLQASTASDFSGAIVSSATPALSATVSPLLGLATYYFRVAAAAGGWASSYTALGSTVTNFNPATPPKAGVPPITGVGFSSASAQWGAATNPAGTTYNLQASTAADFSGTLLTSATLNLSGTVFGLAGNTTYYLEVNAVVNNAPSTFTVLGSTISYPAPPLSAASTFTAASPSSVALQWVSNDSSGTLFTAQASTASDFSGTLFSSATYNAFATIVGLSGNTTYYFRADAAGNGYVSAFAALGSTITTIGVPAPGSPAIPAVFNSSATAQWTTGGNTAGTLYNLQASTASDFSGTILSSQTYGAQASPQGLTGSSSYYLRVDAVVGLSSSPFVALGSTVTLPGAPQAAALALSAVNASSVTAQWLAGNNGPLALFTLQASPVSNFGSGVVSSTTANLFATLSGLAGDGTYYFRVDAGISSQSSAWLSLGSTVTLSAVPTAAAAPFTNVFFTSATAQWASGGNAAGTLYTLQASTASDFSGTLIASATYNLFGQVAGLTAATLYYLRVNAAGRSVSGYFVIGSTATRTLPPATAAPTFTSVGVSSATAQWGAGGNGAGTLYTLQAGLNGGFTGALASSATYNTQAALLSLLANATYYFRVKATVNGYDSAYLVLGSTLTLPPSLSSGNTFYFRQSGSGIFQYDVLQATSAPTSGVDSSRYAQTTAGPGTNDQLGPGYAYISPPVGVTTLPAGTWTFNLYGIEDLGAASTLMVNVYTRTAGGVETLYFTSTYGPELATTKTLYSWTAAAPAQPVNMTDQIVVKVYTADATALTKVGGLIVTFYLNSTGANSSVVMPFDIVAPGALSDLTATNPSATDRAALTWSAPGNDGVVGGLLAGSRYLIQYSTYAVAWATASAQVAIATGPANPGDAQTTLVTGLLANSTQYFRIWTQDNAGNVSAISNATSAVTLANAPTAAANPFTVYATSVTVAWTALPASPPDQTCEGYVLQASSTNFQGGTVYASSTSNAAQSSLTLSGLYANATYYFRVGSLNWSSAVDYLTVGSTRTLANLASGWPASLGGAAASVEGGFDFSTTAAGVYAGTDDGRLVAFNTSGGTRWSFTASNPVHSFPTDSPEGVNEFVYFSDDGGNVYKLQDNGTSAAQVWKRNLTGVLNLRSSPALLGTTVYITATDGKVYALNYLNGADGAGWSYGTSPGAVAFTGTPYADNFTTGINSLFIGAQGGTMYRVNLVDGSVASSNNSGTANIYATPNLDSGLFNSANDSNVLYWGADDGVLRARTSANLTSIPTSWADFTVNPVAAIRTSPYINRNETPKGLYFGCGSGKVYKLNATTGAKSWEYQTGGAVLSNVIVLPNSSTGAGADYVYFGSDDGTVYGLNAVDGSLRTGWPVNMGASVRSGPVYDSATNTITVGALNGQVLRINVGP